MKETTASSRELGFELRRRREKTRIPATELADRMGWPQSKMSRLETGMRGASETDVVQYLTQLGHTCREMRPLLALCREAVRDSGYWLASPRSLAFHESRAEACVSYHPEDIPPPLLVGDESPHSPNPVRHYLLHERTLHRPGLEQVLKLLLLADLPFMTIRVVPARSTFGGAFRVLAFPAHPPLVHLSGHHVGLFVEHDEHVAHYQELVARIAGAALDVDRTRDLLVELATRAQVTTG
jgi:hypothetical protein